MARRKGSSTGSSRTNQNRGGRVATTGTRAMATQRTINQDYVNLFEDYKRLFAQLWRIPATKYILGGVAVGALIPVTMRLLRRYPQINEFVQENMDAVESKFDEVSEKVSEKISDIRGKSQDSDLSESRH